MVTSEDPIEPPESKQPEQPRRSPSRKRIHILKRWCYRWYRSNAPDPYPSNAGKLLLARKTVRRPSVCHLNGCRAPYHASYVPVFSSAPSPERRRTSNLYIPIRTYVDLNFQDHLKWFPSLKSQTKRKYLDEFLTKMAKTMDLFNKTLRYVASSKGWA